jgi:hypothetical protein
MMATPSNLTIAEMLDLLTKLERVRWTGDRRVEYVANGVSRVVEYRSDVELRQAIGDLKQDIAAMQGKSAVNVAYVRSEKGWA